MIPVPCKDETRVNIDPGRERMASFVQAMEGVEYLVIDEMSMLGRRALGHIDYLLRQATGRRTEFFGGKSVSARARSPRNQ